MGEQLGAECKDGPDGCGADRRPVPVEAVFADELICSEHGGHEDRTNRRSSLRIRAGHARGGQAQGEPLIRSQTRCRSPGHLQGDSGIDRSARLENTGIDSEEAVLELGGIAHHSPAIDGGGSRDLYQRRAERAACERFRDSEIDAPAAELGDQVRGRHFFGRGDRL